MKTTVVIEVGELPPGTKTSMRKLPDGTCSMIIGKDYIDDEKVKHTLLQYLLVITADVIERSRPLPPRVDGTPTSDTAEQHR